MFKRKKHTATEPAPTQPAAASQPTDWSGWLLMLTVAVFVLLIAIAVIRANRGPATPETEIPAETPIAAEVEAAGVTQGFPWVYTFGLVGVIILSAGVWWVETSFLYTIKVENYAFEVSFKGGADHAPRGGTVYFDLQLSRQTDLLSFVVFVWQGGWPGVFNLFRTQIRRLVHAQALATELSNYQGLMELQKDQVLLHPGIQKIARQSRTNIEDAGVVEIDTDSASDAYLREREDQRRAKETTDDEEYFAALYDKYGPAAFFIMIGRALNGFSRAANEFSRASMMGAYARSEREADIGRKEGVDS